MYQPVDPLVSLGGRTVSSFLSGSHNRQHQLNVALEQIVFLLICHGILNTTTAIFYPWINVKLIGFPPMEIKFELGTEKAVNAFIARSTAYGLTTVSVGTNGLQA